MQDIASGMASMHHAMPPICAKNLKASAVLLDSNYRAYLNLTSEFAADNNTPFVQPSRQSQDGFASQNFISMNSRSFKPSLDQPRGPSIDVSATPSNGATPLSPAPLSGNQADGSISVPPALTIAPVVERRRGKVCFANAKPNADVRGVLWSAPEVVLGQPYTTATDVYAFGTLLYEILFKRDPTVASTRGNSLEDLDKCHTGTGKVSSRSQILALHPIRD